MNVMILQKGSFVWNFPQFYRYGHTEAKARLCNEVAKFKPITGPHLRIIGCNKALLASLYSD